MYISKNALISIYFLLIVPTEAPSNFHLDSLSSSSISVTWGEIPQEARNGEIIGYLVKYHKRSQYTSMMIWDSIQVDGQTFKVTLNNLTEVAVYHIKVAGVTKEGVGVYSRVLYVTPKQCKSKAYVIKVKHEQECVCFILFPNTEKWVEKNEAQLSFSFFLL